MIKRFWHPRMAILVIGFLVGVPLCYVGFGMALYYWKENTKHFEPGAISCLEALYSMERNYKSAKGEYSVNFEELGIPLGAFSHDNRLTWNEGYFFEFSNVSRDASGRVTDFAINARPFVYERRSRRNFLIDTLGDVYETTEHRPATIRDRNLNTHR
jgi:hypothetical protein